jgi:hypothetical protein
MDILGAIMGWRWKTQRIRRKWDRLREKALEKEGRVRSEALKQLDMTEDKVRMLEEQSLYRRDRVRIIREIELELGNTSDLIRNGEAWLDRKPSGQAPADKGS